MNFVNKKFRPKIGTEEKKWCFPPQGDNVDTYGFAMLMWGHVAVAMRLDQDYKRL